MDATDQTIIAAFAVESRSQLEPVLGPDLDPVREVAAAKTAVLRMSVEALTRHGMPFVGETRD